MDGYQPAINALGNVMARRYELRGRTDPAIAAELDATRLQRIYDGMAAGASQNGVDYRDRDAVLSWALQNDPSPETRGAVERLRSMRPGRR